MNRLYPAPQKGISMIEMLIALVVSSFLILGITQIYIDNKRNSIYQQNQSANQESSRFSLLLLEQSLYKTGYRRRPQDSKELIFKAVTVAGCQTFTAGQVVRPTANGQGVCLRYQRATDTELDCQGNVIPTDDPITVRLERVAAVPTAGLNCYVNGSAASTMVTGITGINFLYGVDINADRIVDGYIPNTDVQSDSVLLSVRYALLHESDSNTVALVNNPYNFPLSATTVITPGDKKLYKSVQGTTTLRNIAP